MFDYKGVLGNIQEMSKSRLAICETCEHYDLKKEQCLKCRCFMRYKTVIPGSKCPIGKWNSINTKDICKEQNNGG